MGNFQSAFPDDRCYAEEKKKVLMWLIAGAGIERFFLDPGFQPQQHDPIKIIFRCQDELFAGFQQAVNFPCHIDGMRQMFERLAGKDKVE